LNASRSEEPQRIETKLKPDQSRKEEATIAEEEKKSRYPRDSTEQTIP